MTTRVVDSINGTAAPLNGKMLPRLLVDAPRTIRMCDNWFLHNTRSKVHPLPEVGMIKMYLNNVLYLNIKYREIFDCLAFKKMK